MLTCILRIGYIINICDIYEKKSGLKNFRDIRGKSLFRVKRTTRAYTQFRLFIETQGIEVKMLIARKRSDNKDEPEKRLFRKKISSSYTSKSFLLTQTAVDSRTIYSVTDLLSQCTFLNLSRELPAITYNTTLP